MYFIPIIVPIFVEGERKLVHSDWKRALELLRDSLGGRYGDLVVAAPGLPADDAAAREQQILEFGPEDGISLEPIYDGRMRAREFWLRELPRLRARLEPLMQRARVVHTGLGDLYRPVMEIPFASALHRGLPTVFVQDTDTVTQIKEEPRDPHLQRRLRTDGYTWLYERTCRASVAHADLSLLKGKELMQRYGAYAKNAREFHNTSYMSSEMAPQSVVEARLSTLQQARPLRFVYCGRLIERKGLDESVRMIEQARKRGADVTFDIIGQGPCEPALRAQIEAAGLSQSVRLLGLREYDASLLQDLAQYDAILFSPTIEDTPRMIFDGYASGVPLVGVEIPYVRERAEEEGATLLLPRGNTSLAAERLVALDRDRSALIPLTRAAFAAGKHHAADIWYERRAQWTHEAIAKKLRPQRPSQPTQPPQSRPVSVQASL